MTKNKNTRFVSLVHNIYLIFNCINWCQLIMELKKKNKFSSKAHYFPLQLLNNNSLRYNEQYNS